jgi:hypothetical protein
VLELASFSGMARIEFRGGPCAGHVHYLDVESGDELVGPCAADDDIDDDHARYAFAGTWIDESSPVESSGAIYGWLNPDSS